jgi:hypothetical protein
MTAAGSGMTVWGSGMTAPGSGGIEIRSDEDEWYQRVMKEK